MNQKCRRCGFEEHSRTDARCSRCGGETIMINASSFKKDYITSTKV